MTQALPNVLDYLENLLENSKYQDEFLNGLQVNSGNPNIIKVAGAVDAGLSVIEKAIAAKADLLITHHGLLDRNSTRLTGVLGKKVELLMKSGCSYYTSHLPLDGNMQVGNAVELARFLNLQEIEPYFEMDGRTIGARARCSEPRQLQELTLALQKLEGAITPLVFNFGATQISSIGIVTGSGSSAIEACAEAKIDLLISGEPKQKAYHLAKELQLSAIFAGHYATETLGIKAVLERLAKDLQISTVFIHEPTGI